MSVQNVTMANRRGLTSSSTASPNLSLGFKNIQMKNLKLLPIILFFALIGLHAQGQDAAKSPCDQLNLDFETGTLNGMAGTATADEVKKAFPCFTGETEENPDAMNCGGGVFYLDHDFFVYTAKDCITARKNFKGKTTKTVLGQPASTALELMGTATEAFVYTDEFFGEKTTYVQYAKDWGTLVLLVNENVVQSIELHYGKKIGEIDFCF